LPVEVAAKRYAQAAFAIASDRGDFQSWQASLNRIAAFTAEPDYARLLESSRVPLETKHRLVDAGLRDLRRLALNFAHVLVDKGRTSLGSQIAEHFTALVEAHEGVARALVTTAVPLTDTERASLAARLQQSTGGRVEVQTEVEPQIIGGVIVQIGDKLFDGSTRARLAALKGSLMGAMA
jgi:F-type H+-transporting ATPase subunit delta